MSEQQPRYCGKWEGEVIKVLVLHDGQFVNFNILEAKTGLTPKGLKMALSRLFKANIIKKDGERYLLVDEDIKNDWTSFLEASPPQGSDQNKFVQSKTPAMEQIPPKKENLLDWITQWREMRNLDFPLETKHFFLEGEYLDELARVLIGKAQREILVTNPYIDSCHLTKALENVLQRRISVKVVARRPKKTPEDKTKRECQDYLRRAGMKIHYDDQIHAKIITIDNTVAIVSSMNLYSASSGGFTKEAGIVSIDQKVVDSASRYILTILEKPESTDTR